MIPPVSENACSLIPGTSFHLRSQSPVPTSIQVSKLSRCRREQNTKKRPEGRCAVSDKHSAASAYPHLTASTTKRRTGGHSCAKAKNPRQRRTLQNSNKGYPGTFHQTAAPTACTGVQNPRARNTSWDNRPRCTGCRAHCRHGPDRPKRFRR